jgi:hypothetical protein
MSLTNSTVQPTTRTIVIVKLISVRYHNGRLLWYRSLFRPELNGNWCRQRRAPLGSRWTCSSWLTRSQFPTSVHASAHEHASVLLSVQGCRPLDQWATIQHLLPLQFRAPGRPRLGTSASSLFHTATKNHKNFKTVFLKKFSKSNIRDV